ncbi:MAG: hypothetical protein Q8L78_03650 [Coxiellaceae bacterium]|nr:hypothetical protein [Coxiellaceae bacterium]
MKRIKIIGASVVFLLLAGCANRGVDPVSTYYGATEYHCYYYSTKNGKVFEGIDLDQKRADAVGQGMCEMATPGFCVLNACVQK